MERLVRKSEWTHAVRDFVNNLRCDNDPPPKFVAPPIAFEGARARECVLNATKYCALHPDHETVKGFKLWVMPKLGSDALVAMVHIVARHKQTGKYVDVTPADKGDEGQKMIFVPSSRLYPGWTAEEITAYADQGFEPRMGSVCADKTLWIKRKTEGNLHQSCVDALALLFCPTLATVQAHMGDVPSDVALSILNYIEPTVCTVDRVKHVIVDATKYRSLHAVTMATRERVDKLATLDKSEDVHAFGPNSVAGARAVELFREWEYEHPDDPPAWNAKQARAPGILRCGFAISNRDQGDLGVLLAQVSHDLTMHNEVEIVALAVRPDARRRGVATKLLKCAEELAQAQGVEKLIGQVFPNAMPLYEALGWEPAGFESSDALSEALGGVWMKKMLA